MSLIRPNPKRDASERLIVDYLRKRGALVIRQSGKGLPDLLIGWCGRWLLAECKTEKKGLTPGQETFFHEARRRGLPAAIIRDWQEAKALLDGYARRAAQ